jgi:hypothetical protein
MQGGAELIKFRRIYLRTIDNIKGAEILSDYGPEFITQFSPFFIMDLPRELENFTPDFSINLIGMFEQRSRMLKPAERDELKELVKPLIEFIMDKDAQGSLIPNIDAYVRILRSYDFLAGRFEGQPQPPPPPFQLQAEPPRAFPQTNLWTAAQPVPVAAAPPPLPIAQGAVEDLFPQVNRLHGILRRLNKLDLLPQGSTGRRKLNKYEENVGRRVGGSRRSRRRRSKARRTRRR